MTRLRGILLAVLVVVLAGAWTGFRLVQARSELEDARAQLTVAKAALLDRDVPAARSAVDAAAEATTSARSKTDDPVVTVVSHVPLLGRSVAVVRGVASAADDVARDVLPTALSSTEQLDPKALRRADGSIDLPLLAKAAPDVSRSAQRATSVDRRFDDLPTSLLPGPVSSVRREFADQLDELASTLRSADDALTLAPSLLGGDKPRRWFVLVQQTSESRGTGGLPGGFAILEARDGKLSVSRTGSNADLAPGRVEPRGLPKDYVDLYDYQGAFDIWQNVNLSPDLPVVSQYVVQRWKAQTGQTVDGVIALDAVALQDLLEGSGPVPLADGTSIAPEGVEEYLALGQYRGQSAGDQSQRKEALTVIADAVVGRLTGGGGDSDSLLRGLTRTVRSGHLHVATQDDAMAPVLRRTGVDGGLPRDGKPFVYPVLFNASGSKLDYFIDRDVRWTGGDCDGERRRTKVSVTLSSTAPPVAQLPPYVTIRNEDGRQVSSDVDRLGLSVYATKGTTLVSATVDGKVLGTNPDPGGYVQSGTEAGLPVWLTYVDVKPGSPKVLELTLDEPVVGGEPRVLEQPLARAQKSAMSVPVCR